MLAQFNSTFYELSLGLTKSTQKCEQRYKRLKLLAFLKIKYHRPDYTDLIAREEEYRRQEKEKKRVKEA
jgi:hypothetical protein